MAGSQHEQKRKRSVAVADREALVFGAVAAVVVLVTALIVTSAWRSFTLLGLAMLYSVVAFAACAGGAYVLNRIVSKEEHDEDREYPIMH